MTQQQLARYFQRVKTNFNAVQTENSYTGDIHLRLAEKQVVLRLSSAALKNTCMPSLRHALAKENPIRPNNASGVFYYWQDEIANYYPFPTNRADRLDIWKHESEFAKIFIPVHGQYFKAHHYVENEVYRCVPKSDRIDFAHTTHPLKFLLHDWAQRNNLLFIHSAAVEIDGCGNLISSVGGKGKSTLAISSLLAGHQYAGDDYVLLDKNACAHMIYGSGYLNQDMLEKLPALKQYIIGADEKRNNKTLIDLSPYSRRFKSPIKIHMILFPNLVTGRQASVVIGESAKAVGQMVMSSARQNGARFDRDFMQTACRAIAHLPVYQINLTSDIFANIRALEQFVNRREQQNVSGK